MKRLFLLLMVVPFLAKAQPVPPSTSPYTRSLLILTSQALWQTALGITGGGGTGTLVTNFITTNGGIGSTANAALTALGGASLTASNQWSTNGNLFPSTQSFTSINTYTTAATVTHATGSTTVTATGNVFAGWPRYGVSFNQGGVNQAWVRTTNNPNQLTLFNNNELPGFTNSAIVVYLPEQSFYDIVANQQGYIGAGAMFGTSSGTFGQGAGDGGYRLEDGIYSTQIHMFPLGGIFGVDVLGFGSDNNNGNPPFVISPLAPNYSYLMLPDGSSDVRVTLTNDTGQLVLENPTLAGAVIVNNSPTLTATNTTPGATNGPKLWISVTVGGVTYSLPAYK